MSPELQVVSRYGRWRHAFEPGLSIREVIITAPDGVEQTRPAYVHQPARLVCDHHGYETVQPCGVEHLEVRCTPVTPGQHQWRALDESGTVQAQGAFVCEESGHGGYVQVAVEDPRWFSLSEGGSYCPIGVNLCWPVYYPLSKGTEFGYAEQRGTLGVADYRRWLGAMADAGGNFARLWCATPALAVETDRAGVLDLAAFARLDAIVELARRHDIRLKLCLEHFRMIDPGTPGDRPRHPSFSRTLRREDGSAGPASCDEWFRDPYWRGRWLAKVEAYLARYGDDPVVMAWELWNEIDCVETSSFDVQLDWTRDMLAGIKRRSPRNLVTNSLGSFDEAYKQPQQDALHTGEMDFQQVHRYLDQGAELEICRTDPVALSIDAVARARRPDRPCLLAETGGVNDNHTGAFRYYRVDHAGTLLHDVTCPPLFAGAAGTGHNWFWADYVDTKGLWRHLTPVRRILEGIRLHLEGFRSVDVSMPQAWALALAGRLHVLLWIRNRSDRWDRVLRDGQPPGSVQGLSLDLTACGLGDADARVVPCWQDECDLPASLPVRDGRIAVPDFRRGMMLRIARR